MSVPGPHISTATLYVEPKICYYLETVVPKNTILALLAEKFSVWENIIRIAGMERNYIMDEYPITFIISQSMAEYLSFVRDRGLAITICKQNTIDKPIDEDTILSSQHFVIPSMADSINIHIDKYSNGNYINNRRVRSSIRCTNGMVYVTE